MLQKLGEEKKRKIKPATYALSPNPCDTESLSKTSATRLGYVGPRTRTNTQPPPPDAPLESLSFPLTHGITPCPFKGRTTATFPLDIQHPLFLLLLYHSQQKANTLLTLTRNPPVSPQPLCRDTSQWPPPAPLTGRCFLMSCFRRTISDTDQKSINRFTYLKRSVNINCQS